MTNQEFSVGNYHMPCMFQNPEVMLIHCALYAQHMEKISKQIPYVLCGDFNIQPDSSMYQLLTEGSISSNHPEYPKNEVDDDWKLTVTPLQSAYKLCNGNEPDFTNYAQVKNDPVFIATLDYIFLSRHWSVSSVTPLPHRMDVRGPLPNEQEPSDHILLAAELKLNAQS